MRAPAVFPGIFFLAGAALTMPVLAAEGSSASSTSDPTATTIRAIYSEALTHGQAYGNLRALVANCPGRLSGSTNLENAVGWAQETLAALKLDRVFTQDVMVPHWERGEAESVQLIDPTGVTTLTACALGGSVATPSGGVLAQVVEVHSLGELASLGREKLAGKIVFFNRPMDPTFIEPMRAYGAAGDQRMHGPAEAAKYGAAAVLVRSLTHRLDDVPHTGVTVFPEGTTKIPAVALSTVAADRLSAALADSQQAGTKLLVSMKVHSRWLPDAPSHNVIGELRGTEFPNDVIVVGGHLDSWDIAPGAHDDGAGVVQAMEVLRIFRALGIKPHHTIRCVAFVNEENGAAGAKAYAAAAQSNHEKHLLALETDAGGFQPHSFSLTAQAGDPASRAARWLPLLKPYAIYEITNGDGGTDVEPMEAESAVVGEMHNGSQRYFDIHHTKEDSIDKVNPRELQLGAAALAALIYLVDTQGL